MESKPSTSDVSSADSIRRTDISRRGGVRVRGGRLPPIRISNAAPVNPNKKVFEPKIPQRRIKVKQEILESSESFEVSSAVKREDSRRERGRGRGARVYLQTEGSFLGQGPAAKAKKDPVDTYERYPRGSKGGGKMKMESDMKVDPGQIKMLLEFYDDDELYSDMDNFMQPVKLPLDKSRNHFSIKTEDQDQSESKPIIKEEPLDFDDSAYCSDLEGKFFTRIKKEYADLNSGSFLQAIQLSKDDPLMVLMQFPSCLPLASERKSVPEGNSTKEKKLPGGNEKDNPQLKNEAQGNSIKDAPEGYLGRLQFLKSGRMQLVMGDVIFQVDSTMGSETVSEAVSIPLKEDGGDLIVLGRVNRKLIVYPQIDKLMEDAMLTNLQIQE